MVVGRVCDGLIVGVVACFSRASCSLYIYLFFFLFALVDHYDRHMNESGSYYSVFLLIPLLSYAITLTEHRAMLLQSHLLCGYSVFSRNRM